MARLIAFGNTQSTEPLKFLKSMIKSVGRDLLKKKKPNIFNANYGS